MENIKEIDNYSLVKKIIEGIPSGLNPTLLPLDAEVMPTVLELSERIKLNINETVLFSAIIHSQMTQKTIDTLELSKLLKTPVEYFYQNQKTLWQMNFKGIIEINFEYQSVESYYINRAVRNSFFSSEQNPKLFKTEYTFIEILDIVHSQFGPQNMTITDAEQRHFYIEKFKTILAWNKELAPMKEINSMNLRFSEQIILMVCLLHNLVDRGSADLGSLIDNTTGTAQEGYDLFESLVKGKNILIKNSYVEQFKSEETTILSYILSQKGKEFLKKFKISLCKKQKTKAKSELFGIHSPEKTKEVPLYFDNASDKEYQRISMILDEKNYKRFSGNNGISKGVNILFYGQPGTGKTESVLQLAKISGRTIFQTNLSAVREKWIGASEKNVQKIFDDYKLMARAYKLKPILLLNEADALLGSRGAVGQYGDQLNNTMQNIFLENLENFEGILIATTNLQNNLDKAFDRRFLIKMNFNLPSKQKRMEISSAKIKEIPAFMHEIISDYEFSGGQLDNISKKIKMFEMLENKMADIETIKNICNEEEVIKQSKNRIGFA